MQYFDHNASSPLCEPARRAWLDAVERYPGNPSSPHRLGSRASRALDEARAGVAEVLGAHAEEVVWNSGATEGNNTVLHNVAQSLDRAGRVWLSALEHPCVLAAARRWLAGRFDLIPVNTQGVVELDWLRERLAAGERPALIGVMAANNETGVHQPWREVLELARASGVATFCDAAQWLGKEPAAGLGGVTWVTGCAHKFGGAAGVGFLKGPAAFMPLLQGGAQEEGRRAGTENVAGAWSCWAALRERERQILDGVPSRVAHARREFEETVTRRIPGLEILGAAVPRLWNTSALWMPEVDCRRRWVVRLDKLGFAVSTGSACASGKEKPSHVLTAMGRNPIGERMVRVSAGWETPEMAWSELAEALVATAQEFGG
ncbi:MAG: aminotransferase class V-fold PLP-dependent enzyme [Verrucomicrobiales bacterium]|nr:aminotransferase class V-fold PLP-dependent enzyme [Verrucomicrobiales bacterium]